MNIETILHEEIVSEFKSLKGMEVGTEKHKTAVESIAKLMDRAIEMEKIGNEKEEKAENQRFEHDLKTKQLEEQIKSREIDTNLKTKQLKSQIEGQNSDTSLKFKQFNDEQRDRLVRNAIAIAGIVVPSIITVWGTLKSIEFEKEGTITTIMGRGFINKLLPKK